MKKVICVLVLYNPDVNLLTKVVDGILDQIDLLWISDNSTNIVTLPLNIRTSEKIVYKNMDGNLGIAAAQNVGIKYAIKEEYDFVYFLDQDSISPKGIVNQLMNQYDLLYSKGINIGAVGPRPYNRKENVEYRGSVKKGKTLYEGITEVTELINSASLVPVNVFKQVGLMDEPLFIDGVDHEFCWRAKRKLGSRFFIVESVKLSHQLGEGDRYFLFRKVAIPTPFRTYYQFRNYFILIRRGYVPIYWKLSNGFKYVIKYFYFPLCVPPRLMYLKNINKGVVDGLFYRCKKVI